MNANIVPASNKYDKIKLDTICNRTLQASIHKSNYPRFSPIHKDAKPAPTSYNSPDAITKSQWHSTKYTVSKDKRVVLFEQNAMKSNEKTGPGSYQLAEAAFSKTPKPQNP